MFDDTFKFSLWSDQAILRNKDKLIRNATIESSFENA